MCTITADQRQKISLVLEAIQLQFEPQDLKARILKCHSSAIAQWKDDNSLDLLHYCILENNIVALILFLSQGHFKPPYESASWPYLHLVACLGHRTFISTIIQDLKFFHEAIILDLNVYKFVIKPKLDNSSELQDAEMSKKQTPTDIAALFGHIGCVRLLLDFWQFYNTSKQRRKSDNTAATSMYLTLACQVNSPNALRLLLQKHTDKKEALESAIRMGVPECIDVVLRDGGTEFVKNAFQGMNLFHVLYSYTSCRSPEQYETMLQTTSVLLRHNQDVNACRPSRTFPLYSLLNHVPACCSFDKIGPHLMAILLLLMSSGAEPNLDEIIIEEKLKDSEQNTAFGRRPYSSAMNALLCTIPLWKGDLDEEYTKPIDDFVYKSVEILLRRGADLGTNGKFIEKSFYETALEELYHKGTSLHVISSTRASCQMSYTTLRLLLRYGVDADARGKYYVPSLSSHINYALNIIPVSVWTIPMSNPTRNPSISNLGEKDLKNVKYIMRFMSQSSLVLAYQEYLDMFNRCSQMDNDSSEDTEGNHFSDEMHESIVQAYEIEVKNPWGLQRYCSHVIWRSCRLHMGNIFDLPIPEPLKRLVLNFH